MKHSVLFAYLTAILACAAAQEGPASYTRRRRSLLQEVMPETGVCEGDVDISSLPYSISVTPTGNTTSTTFVQKVCNTQCANLQDPEWCRPIQYMAVSATTGLGVSTAPASDMTSSSCGPAFTGESLGSLATQLPSDPEHCEIFYWTVPTPNADFDKDMCGGSCVVQIALDNGVVAVSKKAAPEPKPAPYSRRRVLKKDNQAGSGIGNRRF